MPVPVPEPAVVAAAAPAGQDEVLTEAALLFVADLHRLFTARRDELLARRVRRRARIARSGRLDFLPETAEVRADDGWRVAPVPDALQDRRVEITGPADRRTTVDALNSGARVWVADFEDASAPSWRNVVHGQLNLLHAHERRIDFTDPATGGEYALRTDREPPAVLVRPRGWHLDERHLLVDGRPVPGALVDFGLYFFHHARRLAARGQGPYFCLPKLESHLEARLWNDVFVFAQDCLGIAQGTVRATVLIETITAAFEMEEILHELRTHVCALGAGHRDYLFSLIKNFRGAGPPFVLPDREAVPMTAPFLRAYTDLLVRTCHRRGAHAIGGTSAYVPSRTAAGGGASLGIGAGAGPGMGAGAGFGTGALGRVRADKDREAADGFDGSRVAHPDLVPVCEGAFDAVLGGRPHQKDRLRGDVRVRAEDLLAVDSLTAEPTYAGLVNAVQVGIRYLESWLRGTGSAPIFHVLEDTATAELSRSQIWQWIHADVLLDNGATVTGALVRGLAASELDAVRLELGEEAYANGRWRQAHDLFLRVALDPVYPDFLTLAGYRELTG